MRLSSRPLWAIGLIGSRPAADPAGDLGAFIMVGAWCCATARKAPNHGSTREGEISRDVRGAFSARVRRPWNAGRGEV